MRSKTYKQVLLMLAAFLAISMPAIAQDTDETTPAPPAAPEVIIIPRMPDGKDLKMDLGDLNIKLDKLAKDLNRTKMRKLDRSIKKRMSKTLKTLDKDLLKDLADIGPQIAASVKDMDLNLNFNFDDDIKNDFITSDPEEYVKTFSKSYSVDRNDELDINNKYGNITINTWNKNEFKVDVRIKVATRKSGDAQKMLDNVTISDSREGSTVYFKTNFSGENSGGSWSLLGGKRSANIEVNYIVYMPVKNALTVTSKYGSVNLPDLLGKVTINNSHGSLIAKMLSNVDNAITVKYGSANIRGFSGGNLNVAYGSLNLAEGENLNANLSYGSAKIGTIKSSGNINVKYSSGLKIGALDKSLKSLAINSSYSDVNIDVNFLANIDFDVTVHNGDFKYDDERVFVVNKDSSSDDKGWKPTKNFKGHLGKSNSNNNVIIINVKYGSVRFE